MVQIETLVGEEKLEKVRAYARERMRAKRAADPEGVREYMRAWRAANPEKVKARNDAWKIANWDVYRKNRRDSLRRWQAKYPDKVRAMKNAWNRANPEKVTLYGKRRQLKMYGLTLGQRDELFAKQGQRCAICKSADPGSTKGWHIDHCHDTGRVRGILCTHCNLMLGYAKDSETTLVAAIEYLQVGYGAT